MRYIMLNKCIIFLILILFALSFKSSIASDFKFAAAAGLASYDFHNDWEALKTPLMGGVEWTKVKNLPLGIFIAPTIGNKNGKNISTLDAIFHTDLLSKFGIGFSAQFYDVRKSGLVFFRNRKLVLTWRLR